MTDIPIKVEPFSIFTEVRDEFKHYEGPPIKIAVDIGAHHGSLSWLLAEQGALVHAYEPYYYKELCANIDKTVGRTRVIAMPFAVSRSSRFGMIIRLGKTPGNVSLIMNDAETIMTTSASMISFFDVLEIAGPEIDYMKIDCEGGEYTFMVPGSKLKSMLKRVKYLHIEVHGGDNFDHLYMDRYLPLAYQRAGRKDDLLIDTLSSVFSLKEVRTSDNERVFMGPRI